AAGRSETAASGYFKSEAPVGMGTESGVGERAQAFAGIFSPGSSGESAASLTGLFVERGAGGENRQQTQNFFALDRIAEHEAHAHAETGMGGQHLPPDSQFRVGGADQNLHARLPRERRWHFDVATALADIRQGAAIGNATAAAVAGIGEAEGPFRFGRFLAPWARPICGRLGHSRLACRCLGGLSGSRGGMTQLEPGLYETARRLGHIEGANSGAAARILPGNLPRQADQLLLPGKSELEINFAGGRNAAGGLKRRSAVAEVG